MSTHMILSSETPSPITIIMPSPSSSQPPPPSSSSIDSAGADDCLDDGCSICLEPFNSLDPPTVTNCKHEYHLQCILEWSQRSTDCPICCQLLVLTDPTSQELLAAAKIERSMRSGSNIRVVREDHDVNHDASYVNGSNLEEQILLHFAAATGRTRYVNRTRRQMSSGVDSLEAFPAASSENGNNLRYGLATTRTAASTIETEHSPVLPSVVTSDTTESRDGPASHRAFFGQQSPDGPQRSSSSEFHAFSESVKAKLSAASARYKESITKSTRGFKEKLLARNTTVKELGRGVQREMSAGIAGVARMIERLDLSSKRTGVSVPLSSSSVTPDIEHQGKCVEESYTTQHPVAVSGQITTSDVPSFNSVTTPVSTEVSLI